MLKAIFLHSCCIKEQVRCVSTIFHDFSLLGVQLEGALGSVGRLPACVHAAVKCVRQLFKAAHILGLP